MVSSKIDDMIIKSVEEIALNGAYGMTSFQLFKNLEPIYGVLNDHVKNYIHQSLLDNELISLIETGETALEINKPNKMQMVLASAKSDFVIITPSKNNKPSTSTTSTTTTTKSRSKKKVKEKQEKEDEDEEEEKEDEQQKDDKKEQSSILELSDKSTTDVIVSTISTQTKKMTGSGWIQTSKESESSKEVKKQDYRDLNTVKKPFSYMASKELRLRACGVKLGEAPLNEVQSKILEMVANSRGKGITQSTLSDILNIDPRNIFNPIKFLIVRGYVLKFEVYKSATGAGTCSVHTKMLYLTRFFYNRDPLPSPWKSSTLVNETISSLLDAAPNKSLKSTELMEATLKNASATTYKKAKKTMIDEGYIETFKQSLDYQGKPIGKDNKKKNKKKKKDDDEEEEEDDQVGEDGINKKTGKKQATGKLQEFTRLLKPFDPLTYKDDKEKEEDGDEEEVVVQSSLLLVNSGIVHQMYQWIDQSIRGLYVSDLYDHAGNYLESRKHVASLLRNLISHYSVRAIAETKGKNTTYRFITKDEQISAEQSKEIVLVQPLKQDKEKKEEKGKEKEKESTTSSKKKSSTTKKEDDKTTTTSTKKSSSTKKNKDSEEGKDEKMEVDTTEAEKKQKELQQQQEKKEKEDREKEMDSFVLATPTQGDAKHANISGRRVVRTTLYLMREKKVLEKLQELKGVVFTALIEFLHETEKNLDHKGLTYLLRNLEEEGKVVTIKMLLQPISGTSRMITFIYDAKYKIDDPEIKEIITAVKHSYLNYQPKMREVFGPRATPEGIHFNKKIAYKYGMIDGLFLRAKYLYRLMWTYVNTIVNEKGITVFPESYSFFFNIFLQQTTVRDYVKFIPQFKLVQGLEDVISKGTKLGELPNIIRSQVLSVGYLFRISTLTQVLLSLGLIRNVTSKGQLIEYQIVRDMEIEGKKFKLEEMANVMEYWVELQYIGLSDTVNEAYSNLIPRFHNTKLWGSTTGVTRAKRELIQNLFRREPPLSKAELIEISGNVGVRLSKIESLYQSFLLPTNNRNKRKPSAVSRVSRLLKKTEKKLPKPKQSRTHSRRWSPNEDTTLLNRFMELFAPFFESQTTRDYKQVSVNGMPAKNNPIWDQIASQFSREKHTCYNRVSNLFKKYPSYRQRVFNHLKNNESYQISKYNIPDTIEDFNDTYEFDPAKIRRDTWENCFFDTVDLTILRDKAYYLVLLSDEIFSVDQDFQLKLLGPSDRESMGENVIGPMLSDGIIIKLRKANSKNRRYIKHLFKRPKILDLSIFIESVELKDAVLELSIEDTIMDESEYFIFTPLNSGGTVAQAISLLHTGSLCVNIQHPDQVFDLIDTHDRRGKYRQNKIDEKRIDGVLDLIKLSYYPVRYIDGSFLKRDQMEPVTDSRFTEMFDDQPKEEEEEEKEKEEEDKMEIDQAKSTKRVKKDSVDKKKEEEKDEFKEMVEEYCKDYLESEEIKKEFYKHAMILRNDESALDALYEYRELECTWMAITNAGRQGLILKQIVEHVTDNLDTIQSHLELSAIRQDTTPYAILERVETKHLPRLKQLELVQVLFGHYNKHYVDTLHVRDMMMKLPTSIEDMSKTPTRQELTGKRILRPWITVNGQINVKAFNDMVFDIVAIILETPGVRLEQLSFKLKMVPPLVMEFTKQLDSLGYISTQYFTTTKPSLFTRSSFSITAPSLGILDPNYDPKLIFNQFFNPTLDIVNLPTDFTNFLYLADL